MDKPNAKALRIQELQRRFMATPTSPAQQKIITELRLMCLNFGLSIDEHCAEGREKTIALTKLEEALHYAVAAVARPPEFEVQDENYTKNDKTK